MFKKTLFIFTIIASQFAWSAETATGKVKILRQTQGDIYFTIENMPAGISWFFMNPTTTGAFGACDRTAPGHEVTGRMFSLLLSSKVTQTNVKISYCKQGSYGLITSSGGYIELPQ